MKVDVSGVFVCVVSAWCVRVLCMCVFSVVCVCLCGVAVCVG